MVLQVRPTPTRFPTTALQKLTLAFETECVMSGVRSPTKPSTKSVVSVVDPNNPLESTTPCLGCTYEIILHNSRKAIKHVEPLPLLLLLLLQLLLS